MSDRLQEIRARLSYVVEDGGISGWEHDWLNQSRPGCMTDRFIAYAPNDIAWLLDEVERLRTPLLTLDTQTGKVKPSFSE